VSECSFELPSLPPDGWKGMQSHPKLLLVLFLAISGVSYVLAQDEADDGFPDNGLDQALTVEQMLAVHSELDANGDGRASMAEALDHAQKMRLMHARMEIHKMLEKVDTDFDRKISLEELLKDPDMQSEGREEDAEKIFKLADNNGDGKLDADELPSIIHPETNQAVLELMAKVNLNAKDQNKDGLLTAKEFFLDWDSLVGEEFNTISGEQDADFAKLDKDLDGKLDVKELMAWESGRFRTEEAFSHLFEHADKDSDMHVTADELVNSREKIAGSDAHYHLTEYAQHNEL